MSALPIPRLTRAQAEHARRRSVPRAALPLADAGRLRRRREDAEADPRVVEADTRVTLRSGEALLQVFVPQDLLERRIRRLDPALVPEELPDDLVALLLETAFRDDFDRLEALCGGPVAIDAVARGDTAVAPARRLVAEYDAHCSAVDVTLADAAQPDAAARRLATLMRLWPAAPHPLTRLPVPAVVRLGATWLTRGDVASLRAGDVVLAQFTEAAGARLVVAENLLAAARQSEGRWTLTQTPDRAHGPDRREWTMQHDTDAAPAEAAIRDLDELPVQLVFDLGTVAMTLGELRTLGAGAVIELNRDLAQLVRISAHGALVGQGELVEVDGHVGVRIVRLLDRD